MQTLGELLKTLRHERGLTQEKLAQKAQVTARVLRYWESDKQRPREAELESVLTALEATSEEKARVYTLLPDTRTMRLTQAAAFGTIPHSVLGSMPGVGELLRAMRIRRGWTQEQFAEQMQVSRSTVLRWEATRNFPSEEDILRLCRLLKASPEEEKALLSHRLLPSAWQGQLTLEQCRIQFTLIEASRNGDPTLLPLMDLYVLALKRQVRLLLSHSADALHLLAQIEVHHGWWLYMQGRTADACAANWRALNMARGTLPPEEFWTRALNLLSAHAVQGANNAERGIRLLYPWLRLLPSSLHFTVLCDLALYAAKAQHFHEAARFLSRAEGLVSSLASSVVGEPWQPRYAALVKARTLFHSGKLSEAMEYLPAPAPQGDGRIHDLTIWAEMLLAAGDKNAASRYVSEAQTALRSLPLPQRQAKLNQLAQQL